MQTESKGTMGDRLDRVERGLVEVRDGLGALTERVGSLEGRVDTLEQKVDRLTVLAEHNDTEVRKVAEGLRGLDEKMDRNFRDLKDELKKDRAMFMAAIRNHEGRLSALEHAAETGGGSG